MRVLTPSVRPRPRWPLWAFVALPLALVANAARAVANDGSFDGIAGFLAFVAGIGACLLVSRAEERVYQLLATRGVALRLLAALLLGPAGFLVLALAGVALSMLPDVLGFSDWTVAVGAVAGLWWFGAAAGTVPIVIIDVVISALVPMFARRVQLAVLSLVLLLLALAAAVSAVAVEVVARVAAGELLPKVRLDDTPLTPEQIVVQAQKLLAHPGLIVLVTLGVALLLALPALWSATGKLAAAVMERIHPLSRAFDEVTHGARDVRVEEGGSFELREMTARFNAMLEALTLAERMERAFGVYVSQQVLERIRAQHGDAMLPPSLREASVFFADIRGFTSMSEKLSPSQVVDILNRYFARIVPLIDVHGGYLNKFVGDAVVVVFNGPVDQPDHAERATRCALALQAEVAKMNGEGAFPEIGDLKIGVGVATGPMICGNVGSPRQMEYTVIGDTVNLSARLTGQAQAGDVVVSELTARALPSTLKTEALEAITVKGKEHPVRPFRALG